MIPPLIFRSVPEHTTDQIETFWQHTIDLHPGWEHITYRDPIDPDSFPHTACYWNRCVHGAQKAGLIRLEALWTHGGFYLDGDMEMFRSLRPLRKHRVVAAYEDASIVPDAFLAAEPEHPAIDACLSLAVHRLMARSGDWRTDGPWGTGPGVTTTILPGRQDVTLLGPEAFYEVTYTAPDLDEALATIPPHRDAYGRHWWRNSWQGGR